MTYPPDDHRASRGTPLEQDRNIVTGSILAIAAFVIVVGGIAWYAVSNNRAGTASIKAPAFERSVPDATTGYGGAGPKAPAPKSTAQ